MRKMFGLLVVLLVSVLAGKINAEDTVLINFETGDTLEMSQAEWEKKEKAEAVKLLFEKKCGKCHSYQRPLSKNKGRDEWKETVERMQKKDPAWILPAEAEKIVNYLSEIRGVVIDTTQEKIVPVLELKNK